MNQLLKNLIATAAVAVLSACGGGGGSAGTSPFGGSSASSCTGAASSAAGAASGPGCVTAAASLALQLDVPTIDNSGSGSVKATATALTAAGQALTGVPVTFSVDNKAAFTVTSIATGSNGQVVATVTSGADSSNRIVTVTATSGSLTTTASFSITGAKLTGTRKKANVLPGETDSVDFHLTNSNGIAMAGQTFTVTAGSLASSTGVSDVSGNFSYVFTAPATTGAIDIMASAGGTTNTQTVTVSTVSTVPIVDLATIQSASVAANPSVVSTNTTGTTNRTEIRALFIGVGNKPIPNVRVRFDLAGDPSNVGGSFSAGDNTATGDRSVVLTDQNGVATTAYIPANRSSPTNGVTIRACYGGTDAFAVCNPVNSAATTITVVADPLAVTIGSNEKVYVGTNDLTYIRKFVVQVVDASGRAKGNVNIVPSVDIDRYYKGSYVKTTLWVPGYINDSNAAVPGPVPECFNEDMNRNGVNEAGDDINHSGALDPRKSDVAISIVGSSLTDSSGAATVQIEYPKNVATWARVKILVSATGVSGTEGRATWTEILPAEVAAFTGAGAPAFVNSPYGFTVFNAKISSKIVNSMVAYFMTYPDPAPADSTANPPTPAPPVDLASQPFPFTYPDKTTPVAGTTLLPCQNPY